MKKHILLIITLLLLSPCIFAQQVIISGKVTSIEDDTGIPGVTVSIKNRASGTITDINGDYTISANRGEVLKFSYMGFNTREVTVGSSNVINIALSPSVSQLDEVVVTALGVKRQKREVGYTIESVPAKELQLSNAGNLASALSGRSAGVQVINTNGVDGGTTRFVIRGVRNLNDRNHNQPLIVVDGIPMENEPGLTDIGRGVDWGSALNNINSFDIESVDILKGPAASALYGSRGANGVVMIATRRGSRQKGIGITYNVSHKMMQPYRFREVQNIYGAGGPLSFLEPTFQLNEAGEPIYPTDIYSDFGPLGEHTATTFGYYGSSVSWGPEMKGQMIRWWDGEMRPFSPQPDNLNLYFKNGGTTTHNIAFNGGGEMGAIRVSLTNSQHDANIPNSNFKQTTINLGSNLRISDKLTSDITISYIDYFRLNSPTIGESENSFGKAILYSWPRSYKGIEKEHYASANGSMIDYRSNSPYYYIDKNFW
ncbi:MAG TPA: TonB-dependent receptor plug domain-containing protein, partial [Bacteroidales bacterium]|nr:TonB-dependent receptor plug domain-containing protein [Bacteroidales bacterium]